MAIFVVGGVTVTSLGGRGVCGELDLSGHGGVSPILKEWMQKVAITVLKTSASSDVWSRQMQD